MTTPPSTSREQIDLSGIHRSFTIDGMGIEGETPVYMVMITTMFESLEEAKKAKKWIEYKQDTYDKLEKQFKRYQEFVNKYKDSLQSINKDSNYAENEAIYNILKEILSR